MSDVNNTNLRTPGVPIQPIGITLNQLRHALEKLRNPHELARSPLAALRCVQSIVASRAEPQPLRTGLALQQVLIDAIDQLKPQPSDASNRASGARNVPVGLALDPSPSDEPIAVDTARQPHFILTRRFIYRNTRYETIANNLAVGKSTYYRKLDEALALLLTVVTHMELDAIASANADVNTEANTAFGFTGESAAEQSSELTSSASSALLAVPPTPNYEMFIGRDEITAQLIHQLNTTDTDAPPRGRAEQRINSPSSQPSANALGLWGLPGSGKTTLLIQLANDPAIREAFPDGILWGSLGRNPNVAALAQAWCMAMHVPPARLNQASNVTDKIKLLHEVLAHCRVLIIIDDVWRADDALPLKVRGPNTSLLFSTRFPDVAAALAGANTFKVGELTEADSLNMLATFAPFAVQSFPERAQSLARDLGGLPLALVIAGQFLQQAAFANQPRRVQQAFDRIDDALFRLALPDSSVRIQGDDPSNRTLNAVIAQSVEMLHSYTRRALQHLSLMPQRPLIFSEAEALAILETDTTGTDLTKQDALDELVNMGLLDVVLNIPADGADYSDGRSLYSIHQVIADYAANCAGHRSLWECAAIDRGERDAVLRRIIRHYASLLDKANTDGALTLEITDIALTNYMAAAHAAHTCGLVSEGCALAFGLYPHLDRLGMWEAAVSLLSPLLSQASQAHIRRAPALHCDVLLKLANAHRLLRHTAQAEAFAQSAEMLVRQFNPTNLLDHAALSSRIYELQANILMDKGEHRAAIQRCTLALEAGLEARAPDLAEQARHTMALAFELAGDYDRMTETLEPSNASPSPLSPPSSPSQFLRHVHLYHCQARSLRAVTLFLQAKLPEAEAEAAAALDIAHKSHNRRWTILILEWLGWIKVTLGKYDDVLNLMSEVFTLARTGDFKEDLIFLYVDLGLVAKARGALDEAEQHLSNALNIASQVAPNHMNGRATLHCTQARIQLAKGQLEQAEAHAHLAISSADNHIETIPPTALLGYVRAKQDRARAADDFFAQALRQNKRLGLIDHTILNLFARHYQGESDLALGRFAKAAADFSAAYAMAERARSPEAMGITRFGLARACAAEGQSEQAHTHAQTALSLLQPIGHIYADAVADLAQFIKRNGSVGQGAVPRDAPIFTTAYGF